MDIPKILRRLLALRRMAKGQEGTPEGDNATRHAGAWANKHGLDIPDESLETGEELFKCEQFWEMELIIFIGHTLELDVYKLKSGDIRLTGIRVILDEAMSLYGLHRRPLERVINFSMVGYIYGAMPEGVEKAVSRESERGDGGEIEDSPKARLTKEDLGDPSEFEVEITLIAKRMGEEGSRPLWMSLKTK